MMVCDKGEAKFVLEVDDEEPHIQKAIVYYGHLDGTTSARIKWEIHKLEDGFVVCCGISQKPKYIFTDEDLLTSFLMRTCGKPV